MPLARLMGIGGFTMAYAFIAWLVFVGIAPAAKGGISRVTTVVAGR